MIRSSISYIVCPSVNITIFRTSVGGNYENFLFGMRGKAHEVKIVCV